MEANLNIDAKTTVSSLHGAQHPKLHLHHRFWIYPPRLALILTLLDCYQARLRVVREG